MIQLAGAVSEADCTSAPPRGSLKPALVTVQRPSEFSLMGRGDAVCPPTLRTN